MCHSNLFPIDLMQSHSDEEWSVSSTNVGKLSLTLPTTAHSLRWSTFTSLGTERRVFSRLMLMPARSTMTSSAYGT